MASFTRADYTAVWLSARDIWLLAPKKSHAGERIRAEASAVMDRLENVLGQMPRPDLPAQLKNGSPK